METGKVTISGLIDAVLETENDLRKIPKRNYPSRIGHPCERFLTLLRLPDIERNIRDGLMSLFRAGRAHEDAVIEFLTRSPNENKNPGLGFLINRQQTVVDIPGTNMHGRIEGMLEISRAAVEKFGHGQALLEMACGRPLLCEIKSMNPQGFSKVVDGATVEECFQDDKFYAGWPGQGYSYMGAMKQHDMVWFVSPRGDFTNIKCMVQHASPVAFRALVEKSNRIDKHVLAIAATRGIVAGTNGSVERIMSDRGLEAKWCIQCEGCDFESHCWDAAPTGEVDELVRPELCALLNEAEELAPLVKRAEEIKRRLKTELSGVDARLCSAPNVPEWAVTGSMVQRKGYMVDATEYWNPRRKRIVGA